MNDNNNNNDLTPEERRAERLRRIKEAQLAANQNKNTAPTLQPNLTPHTAESTQLSKSQATPPGSSSPSSEKTASAGNSNQTVKRDLAMERAHKMLIDAAKRGPNKGVQITNADFDPSTNGIPHIIFPLPVSGEEFIDIFHTELLSSVLILNQSMAQKLQMLVKLPGTSGQIYPPTFNVQAALDATLPDNYIKVAYPKDLDEKGNGEIITFAFYITEWPELFGLQR